MGSLAMRYLYLVPICAVLLAYSCSSSRISKQNIGHAQKLIGIEFADERIDTLHEYLERNLAGYDSLRHYEIPHQTFPAILFDPHPLGFQKPDLPDSIVVEMPSEVALPDDLNDIAYYSIPQLSALLKSGRLTSVQLTELYLERLKKYNPTLECVISITEALAMKQARKMDEELANGTSRGLLHGIPYGTKDLMSVAGYRTTWGAKPYKFQEIDHTATVIRKLEDAGAVLVAKLTSGALARGDVWFDGKTKNPWDTLQGASGSSAGSGSATAAGLVGFSLGTETLGSITSPSNRNGVTGLRPTYGRVSRDGVMSLSWSMDKVGPICRSAQDCAIVFDAIRGKDELDKTTYHAEAGFDYRADLDLTELKVAYLSKEIREDTTMVKDHIMRALAVLDSLGIQRDSIALPSDYPFDAYDIILRAESGAMFDELVRSGRVDMMVQQSGRSRANSLRQSRFIPAVEYLQANRSRNLLIEEINELFKDYDVIISPTFGGKQLQITNLTGHPVITIPTGFDEKGHPTSMTFVGNLYHEGVITSLAHLFQKATDFHLQKPSDFE